MSFAFRRDSPPLLLRIHDALSKIAATSVELGEGSFENTRGPFGALDLGTAAASAESLELDPPSSIPSKLHARHKQIEAISLRAVCHPKQRRSEPSHTTKHTSAWLLLPESCHHERRH